MPRRSRQPSSNAGFTLAEVIVAMFLISLMCLSVFAGLQQITKSMLSVAVRSEGYHLLQAESERLLASDFDTFVASADQTITSSVKTSYAPSKVAPLTITGDNAVGRIRFTRRVVQVESTGASRTLRVEVEWKWDKRTQIISTLLYRNLE
ncbi:prepilin-type N-terminal cleavage/methylation domain-containing protein [Opitutus sp. ER46]|uniref:PulJ/GspJ family protein n=1 Tax=Opitutus sp. ER46 TaxID=2161864 RepID=UPI000D2F72A5|nr:prepilin-type N-terminal cleavage/methylation domain-containing protein [Opitutus sp. ER46]PTX91387.1 hypothetical protein DB354_15950 [Opitutus sp. ER46]